MQMGKWSIGWRLLILLKSGRKLGCRIPMGLHHLVGLLEIVHLKILFVPRNSGYLRNRMPEYRGLISSLSKLAKLGGAPKRKRKAAPQRKRKKGKTNEENDLSFLAIQQKDLCIPVQSSLKTRPYKFQCLLQNHEFVPWQSIF